MSTECSIWNSALEDLWARVEAHVFETAHTLDFTKRLARDLPIAGFRRRFPRGRVILTLGITARLQLAPARTPAGWALLRSSRTAHARAARAPLRSEMALAFALAGPAVLIGTPYAALGRQIQPSGGGCGGGDAGGGCGGGGCGGCGGGD